MIERIGSDRLRPDALRPAGEATGRDGGFAHVLARRLAQAEPLRFSAHALDRLEQRGIELDPGRLDRLHQAVGRAASKGARSSLVLVDETAFVVSITNRTVITALDRPHLRQHVFTNIDSAVLA